MPKPVRERLLKDWDAEVAKAEKNVYHKDEARKLYAEKKLKDGEIFAVKGCMSQYPGESAPREDIVLATMVFNKFIFVRFSAKDRRIDRLKRNAVASLMDTVKKGFVNTRQAPWLPHRYQSLKDPDFQLHGADSVDDNFEGPKFKDKLQTFTEEEIMQK